MPNKTDTKKATGIDKIPSTHGLEARTEASKAQAGRPGDVTTDQGPGKRMFQTGPEEHKWLTEDEAKAAGFFWKPDPEAAKKKA